MIFVKSENDDGSISITSADLGLFRHNQCGFIRCFVVGHASVHFWHFDDALGDWRRFSAPGGVGCTCVFHCPSGGSTFSSTVRSFYSPVAIGDHIKNPTANQEFHFDLNCDLLGRSVSAWP